MKDNGPLGPPQEVRQQSPVPYSGRSGTMALPPQHQAPMLPVLGAISAFEQHRHNIAGLLTSLQVCLVNLVWNGIRATESLLNLVRLFQQVLHIVVHALFE